jgi:transcriptional regulator with XRE-family HTH domain
MVGKKAEGTEGFVKRLNQACDDVPHIIPPHGEGRQIELAKRMGMSQEGVRKWFAGEAMPRRAMMHKLAMLLEVEEPWLALGIMPELSREEKKVNARNVDGAVLLVMGLLTMAGGACALPADHDVRKGYVDFYAILRGTQMAIHVSLARNTAPGVFEIILPREYKDVRTIAVLPLNNNRFDFLDLDAIHVPKFLYRKSGAYGLSLTKGPEGTYTVGDLTLRRLKHFGELA